MTKPQNLSLLFSLLFFSTSYAQTANEGPGQIMDLAPEQRYEVPVMSQFQLLPGATGPDEAGSWPVKTLTLLLNLTHEEQLYA